MVIDNCEHVLDAAADMIEAIFSHSQTVNVLATSREGLRVADEHLWAVPSLDLKDGVESSAAALFVERQFAQQHSLFESLPRLLAVGRQHGGCERQVKGSAVTVLTCLAKTPLQ